MAIVFGISTPAPDSVIGICNSALTTYLGHGRITSLSEVGVGPELCSIHFWGSLRRCLSRNSWTFARKRRTLAQVFNDNSAWAYKYQIPSDCLLIHWVNTLDAARVQMSRGLSPDIDREVVGDKIYCDILYAFIQYTADISDPTLLPSYFTDAVAANLAAAISFPLTQDRGLMQRAIQSAAETMDLAMALDAQNETPVNSDVVPSWLNDRGIY